MGSGAVSSALAAKGPLACTDLRDGRSIDGYLTVGNTTVEAPQPAVVNTPSDKYLDEGQKNWAHSEPLSAQTEQNWPIAPSYPLPRSRGACFGPDESASASVIERRRGRAFQRGSLAIGS